MALSDEVRFLEEEVAAFEEMYREEIRQELKTRGADISLWRLTRYDWASSLANHFYPMTQGDRHIGLILPFRREIFHSLAIPYEFFRREEVKRDETSLAALRDFSGKKGYKLGYYEFAWQNEPVIKAIQENTEPEGLIWMLTE